MRLMRVMWACAMLISLTGPTVAQASSADVRLDRPVADNGLSCPRACLLRIATTYTEALTDNAASRLPVAASVRTTSNGTEVKPGQGEVWGPSRRLPFREVFVDPETGSIAIYAVVSGITTPAWPGSPQHHYTADEMKREWIFVARLKVENKVLTEIEEASFHPEANDFPGGTSKGGGIAALLVPDRIWDDIVPEEDRSTREALLSIANSYFSALGRQIDPRTIVWHPECQRLENGAFTTNSKFSPSSCEGAFVNSPVFKWIVGNRRFFVADVTRGVVFGVGVFAPPPDFPKNVHTVVFEVFKIQDGMIRHIEAVFNPNVTASGWPDFK